MRTKAKETRRVFDLQNRVMADLANYIKSGGDLRDDTDEADKQRAMDELKVRLECSSISNNCHSNGDQSSLRGLEAQVLPAGGFPRRTLSRC